MLRSHELHDVVEVAEVRLGARVAQVEARAGDADHASNGRASLDLVVADVAEVLVYRMAAEVR